MSSTLQHLSYCHLSVLITTSFILSPEHLQASLHVLAPPSTLPLLVMHPSRYYEMSIDNLDKLLSCLAARLFSREDCSIRPLAPLFAYLRIWNSLIHQNVGRSRSFAGSPRCACTLTKKMFVPAERKLLFPLQSSFAKSRWLRPEYPRQAPPPMLIFYLTNSPIDCLQQWLVFKQIQHRLLYQRVTKR